MLTTQNEVVLRKDAVALSRYRKHVIDDAKRISKSHVQQALARSEQITKEACEEGYKSGLLLLLADFTQALEQSLLNYQTQLLENQRNLTKLMGNIFDDDRIKLIIAEHFSTLTPMHRKATLYVPSAIIEKMKNRFSENEHITIVHTNTEKISLQIDEKIIQITPSMVTKNIAKDIFSPAERCTLIVNKINHYKKLSSFFSQEEEANENRK